MNLIDLFDKDYPLNGRIQMTISTALVYLQKEPRRRSAAKLLSKAAARRIAANIAKLPELLSR